MVIRVIASLLAGCALGWLTALSASPILITIVPALLTAVLAAIPLIEALQKERASDLTRDLTPLAALVVGVACGSTLGIYAISFAQFAPRPAQYERLADAIKDKELRKSYLSSLVTHWSIQGPLTVRNPLQSAALETERSPTCQSARSVISSGVQPTGKVKADLLELVEHDRPLYAILSNTEPQDLAAAIFRVCP